MNCHDMTVGKNARRQIIAFGNKRIATDPLSSALIAIFAGHSTPRNRHTIILTAHDRVKSRPGDQEF
jgi:hypothetical protein